VNDSRDRRDVSKNNLSGQLKQGEFNCLRGELSLSVTYRSQTTFFGNNCKIADTISVNSFAKLYFIMKRPFHLPLYQRMISLHFPKAEKSQQIQMKSFPHFFVFATRGITLRVKSDGTLASQSTLP
jgi:hypothetical protein